MNQILPEPAPPAAPVRTVPAAVAWPGGRPERSPPRWLGAAVAALLVGFAVLAYSASLRKGVSFDEGLQLAAGYNIWRHHDYRVEGANGDFVKRWATLPLLVTRPNFIGREDPRWRQIDSYELGRLFLFELGNRPEALLRQGRAMMVLLGVATVLLIFVHTRAAFGWVAGGVALLLGVTSPHLIAFSAIVSTDITITLALPAATLCVWGLLHRVTAPRLAAGLLVFGGLLLAKLSALVILPITVVLLAVRLADGRPLSAGWRGREWMIRPRRGQAAVFAGLIGVHALAGWGALWAHYGFRYSASPVAGGPAAIPGPREYQDQRPGVFVDVVRWSRERRLLPEGFAEGVEWLLGSDDSLPAFMDGEVKLGGWRGFFPYAIWVKTQPSLFLLLGLGAAGLAWGRRAAAGPRAEGGAPGRGARWYAAVPHVVLIGVYLGVAVTEDINIGHRHVLPIYPSLYVLTGAVVAAAWRRAAWVGAGAGLLLAGRAGETALQWPHYLAYFGPQAGGSRAGYTHLVDSSLDWGMDLPALKEWLERHNPGEREPVFLAYFGTDSPRHHGIKAHRLPGFRPRRDPQHHPYRPGYYAISATLLPGAYLPAFGRWNPVYERIYQVKRHHVRLLEQALAEPDRRGELLQKKPAEFWRNELRTYDYFRFGRLCAWLRQQGAPPFSAGHSILIWRLSAADLQAALEGPPPELHEPPAEWRAVVRRRGRN